MNKKGLFLGMASMSCLIMAAAPLTPEEALSRAVQSGFGTIGTRGYQATELRMSLKTKLGEPAVYVFSDKDNPGFMVLSADDCTDAVLGFSDSGNFDENNMSPSLKSWLEGYASQIEYMRQECDGEAVDFSTRTPSLPTWDPIPAKIKTTWNQNAPYNKYCPSLSGTVCPTGCVATSMAQLMNYYEWPKVGTGTISYSWNSQTLKVNLAENPFDYDNMLDSYNGVYNVEQGDAVANLMRACGYAVKMNYTAASSGAISADISGAMYKYFNYDRGVRYLDRSNYTYTEWAQMIYDNLKTVGPIIYDGDSSTSGGHSFIVDGYYGSGFFHLNWGWGGTSDGFFKLDALNPSAIGTGGGGGGFNFTQDALFNLRPATSNPDPAQNEISIYGSAVGSVNAQGILSIGFNDIYYGGIGFQGLEPTSCSIGIKSVKLDQPNSTPQYVNSNNYMNYTLSMGRVYTSDIKFLLSNVDMEQGVPYKMTLVGKTSTTDWSEVAVGVGLYNYVIVTKNGSQYTVENMAPMQFTTQSLSLDSELNYGNYVKVTAKIKNNNDTEISRGLRLMLLDADGIVKLEGQESIMVSLSPGQSSTETWSTSFAVAKTGKPVTAATEFYMALYDIETETIYYKSSTPVVMNPNPGAATYTVDLTIEDMNKTGQVYIVDNAAYFKAVTTLNVSRGYFAIPVTLYVLQQIGNSRNYSPLLALPYDVQYLQAGESADLPMYVSFPDAVVGQTYMLQNFVSGSYTGTQVMFNVTAIGEVPENAGVEQIVSSEDDIKFIYVRADNRLSVLGGEDGISSVEVFSLNGIRQAVTTTQNINGYVDIDTSSLGKGIVVVTATDRHGNRQSTKIAL